MCPWDLAQIPAGSNWIPSTLVHSADSHMVCPTPHARAPSQTGGHLKKGDTGPVLSELLVTRHRTHT